MRGDDSVDLHTYVYDIDLHVDIIIDIFIMVIYYGTMIDFLKNLVTDVLIMMMSIYLVLAFMILVIVMAVAFFVTMIVETTLNTLSRMIKGSNITIRRGL